MDEIEFNYINEGETHDNNLNDDYKVWTVHVNKDGKKTRGKDLSWVRKMNFNFPKTFEVCEFLLTKPWDSGGVGWP